MDHPPGVISGASASRIGLRTAAVQPAPCGRQEASRAGAGGLFRREATYAMMRLCEPQSLGSRRHSGSFERVRVRSPTARTGCEGRTGPGAQRLHRPRAGSRAGSSEFGSPPRFRHPDVAGAGPGWNPGRSACHPPRRPHSGARGADAANSVFLAFILGYVGGSEAIDDALAEWACSYADQTEADHAALEKAVQSGRLPAERGV